jgi:hypothetical protein
MRRRGRRDANHALILKAWRRLGAVVIDNADKGGNEPDAIVAFQGRVIAAEIKSGRNTLSSGQAAWLASWPGETAVVRSVDEAIQLVTGRAA